jgi:hypothetical protein
VRLLARPSARRWRTLSVATPKILHRVAGDAGGGLAVEAEEEDVGAERDGDTQPFIRRHPISASDQSHGVAIGSEMGRPRAAKAREHSCAVRRLTIDEDNRVPTHLKSRMQSRHASTPETDCIRLGPPDAVMRRGRLTRGLCLQRCLQRHCGDQCIGAIEHLQRAYHGQ